MLAQYPVLAGFELCPNLPLQSGLWPLTAAIHPHVCVKLLPINFSFAAISKPLHALRPFPAAMHECSPLEFAWKCRVQV